MALSIYQNRIHRHPARNSHHRDLLGTNDDKKQKLSRKSIHDGK
jgi:hypothetical protein